MAIRDKKNAKTPRQKRNDFRKKENPERQKQAPPKKTSGLGGILKGILILLLVIALIVAGIYFVPTSSYSKAHEGLHNGVRELTDRFAASKKDHKKVSSDSPEKEDGESEEAGGKLDFKPHAVSSTEPSNLIKSTQVKVEGEVLENASDYKAEEKIRFGKGGEYRTEEELPDCDPHRRW